MRFYSISVFSAGSGNFSLIILPCFTALLRRAVYLLSIISLILRPSIAEKRSPSRRVR